MENQQQQSLNSLAIRGRQLANNPARVDMELFMDASENLYHPTECPEGAFQLNVAENSLVSPVIQARFEQITQTQSLPSWTLKYTSTLGYPDVLETVASFMRTHFGSEAIQSDNIAFSAGASASLEVLSFVLGNPNDVVVIPAPSYPMYTNDLGLKSGLERYDLQTHHNIDNHASLALLTTTDLEKAWDDLQSQGKNFKILLITSPDNPTGSVYSTAQLEDIAQWCISKEIHLVVNEIYALSQIDISAPEIGLDFEGTAGFISFTQMMATKKSPYLHLVYALSKDFGISGFRFGVIHSLNESVITALSNVNIPHLVSNPTQWMVGAFFEDETFIKQYVKDNQQLLTESYKVAIRAFREMGLPYTPSRGSLFIWVDFSKFLSEQTAQAEERLWVDIYRKTGILLTPGKGFMHQKYGLFRVVYTAVPIEYLRVAMERLCSYNDA